MIKDGLNWLRMKWLTSYKLNAVRTNIFGLLHPSNSTRLILVLGCQRSGTTMLASSLGLSPYIKAYGEGDAKYFYWDRAPRFLPLDVVANRLAPERNPFTLLKPLCDSQRAGEILSRFPNSRGLWIFRHYRDCVTSHINYYGQVLDGMDYVKEMLRIDQPCWKNDQLTDDVVEFLRPYADRQFNIETAYALYWLARNSHIRRFSEFHNLRLVQYEQILDDPIMQMQQVFDFVGVPFHPKYARIIGMRLPRRQQTLDIDPQVAETCDEIYQDLVGTTLSQDAPAASNSY